MGGAKAHYDGIVAFSQTDFTEDLKKITVPVLVMHGDDDQIVPYADSGPLSAELLPERHPEDVRRTSRTACRPPRPRRSTRTCWSSSSPERRRRGRPPGCPVALAVLSAVPRIASRTTVNTSVLSCARASRSARGPSAVSGVAAPVCPPVVQSTVNSRSLFAIGNGPSSRLCTTAGSVLAGSPDSSAGSTFSIASPPVSWSPTHHDQRVGVLARRTPGPAPRSRRAPARPGWCARRCCRARTRRWPPPRPRGRSPAGRCESTSSAFAVIVRQRDDRGVLVALPLGELLEHLLVGEQPEHLVGPGRRELRRGC